ncbi:MAG: uL15 family ribosomal protein [Clostridia bacterium]|nr:uL15 family ribosomal protein [Clostridia bacterium]
MKKAFLTLLVFFAVIMTASFTAMADSGTSPEVVSLSIESYPERRVYGAFDKLDTEGLSLKATFSDGSVRELNPEEISVIYNRDEGLRVGDKDVTLSYGGKGVKLPVTVNPISYDLSVLSVNNISTVYNGKYQSYTELLPSIVGLDGIPLVMSAIGGGINAGEYNVSIDFSTQSKDYLTPESRVITMKIEPVPVEIIWSDLSFTYDGKSKAPTASYTDVNGKVIPLSVIGASAEVGKYTARVSITDPNYLFSSTTAEYEIKKASYDLSSVSWSADSFIYDGSQKSVTLSGLPKGVRVIGYSGDTAKDAGRYTVTASLAWDEGNYNAPTELTHTWQILPAEYDMSAVSFQNAEYVYDGNIHYPKLIGEMPVGHDGIELEYTFSTGACHVDEGTVTVTVSFKTKSKNYIVPQPIYSSVSITPLGINVTWDKTQLSYSGERQTPTATSTECKIKVTGGALTVGRYTATAESLASDYYVINDKQEFSIVKADNYWVTSPSASTCYEGREININGKSRFGEVKYSFYSDPEGKRAISAPTSAGVYYAMLSVADTMNYSGLRSSLVRVEILEIKAVSFVASIGNIKLRAFDMIEKSDLICSVINNDGSRSTVDSSKVKIIYKNGNSLRKNDDSVILRYDSFSFSLPVEVEFAEYDVSDVVWLNSVVTYDGETHRPVLYGLPDGVSVIEYVGGGVTDAGKYTVSASLDYDRENYSEPKIPPCEFIIEKKALTIPHLFATYNGKPQIPTPDSSLYSISSVGKFVDRGVYSLAVTLTDSKNYYFSETESDRANAIFEILPATIFVSIDDVRLHLFEELSSAKYYVTDGEVFGADFVPFSFYSEGGVVYARSENPNYVLDVRPGRLIRLPYPTLIGGIMIIGFILLAFLLVLALLLAYKNRKKLATSMAILKCRIHHRNFTVAPPKNTDDQINSNFTLPRVAVPEECEERAEQDYSETEIDAQKADSLITDQLAKSLLKKEGDVIYTEGSGREVINIGIISDNFNAGDVVDVNSLKAKGLIEEKYANVRILSGGRIDKALTVYANDFSLSAVKMIALSGGKAIKCVTLKGKPKEEKD